MKHGTPSQANRGPKNPGRSPAADIGRAGLMLKGFGTISLRRR